MTLIIKPFEMDDKLQKENIKKEIDDPVKSASSQPPECIVCATTSPETPFIRTARTKLGTSLLVFVQKCIKPSWNPENQPKCITICQQCLDAVNNLEKIQMKVKMHGGQSSDSDSDGEWNKEAISNIKLSKIMISKIETSNNLNSNLKIEPSVGDDHDVQSGKDGNEQTVKDDILAQILERDREKEENTTQNCNICNRKYFRFSYGRDLTKENRTDKILDCLMCQLILIPRPCKRRKPLSAKKPFGCLICRKRFMQEESLEAHIKSHTRQDPYQCHACEFKFDKRYDFLAHIWDCKPCVCGIKCFQVLET